MTLLFPERFTPLNWIQSPCAQLPTPPVQMVRPLEWLLHDHELRVTDPPLPEELLEEPEEELEELLDEELLLLPLPKLMVQLPLALFHASAATMQ